MPDLLEVLVAGGVRVSELANWRSRERPGTFQPIGTIMHHTATPWSTRSTSPSLRICTEGRTDLLGPLCNGLIGYDGMVYLISDGRCNDSGMGSSVVLNEVRRDIAPAGDSRSRGLSQDTNGNPYFFDWEVDHPGNADPYKPAQLEAVFKIGTALCRAYGWSANRVIHHREWSNQKIDMSWRGDLRGEISRRLAAVAPPPAPALVGDDVPSSTVVDIELAPEGGKWVCAADGGVFAIEGAPFHGGLGGHHLNAPVVDLVPYSRNGYWLVAADGGIFNFGAVPFVPAYGQFQVEYAAGAHRMVSATWDGRALWCVNNNGDRYALAAA